MHPEQTDLLLVLKGTRNVDLYNHVQKEMVSFTVTPDQIYLLRSYIMMVQLWDGHSEYFIE